MTRHKKKKAGIHFTPIIDRVKVSRYSARQRIRIAPYHLKRLGHQLLYKVFGKNKIAAYEWLYSNSYSGHFSNMSEIDAVNIIKKLRNLSK